ncbi:UDP-glucose 4-epimerase-like protein [Euroglyphus maynei]|uniref:UDP-glucose 4-epimerase n=1 Tax=Euroglyphus maynei TaxID=6958 RepID=A0A1Y3AU98_EURMA|nr:UDP-glucose 4-epimerase-like protein [Euroglyphus maynei]
MNNNLILVTGAAGYVGSHCLVELLNNGYDVVVIDNCSNSIQLNGKNMPESLIRVQSITGRKLVNFYQEDINNVTKLEEIFTKHRFVAVMHFAALKAVGESCKIPLDYYHNNVSGTITLLEVMRKYGVKKFIFSSSATVYGHPDYLPIDENHRTGNGCTNPYGRTKYFIEEILKDLCASEKGWCVASLRYFNPVGAHESGEIGEDPQGIPNNLMPYISQVAVRRQPFLKVFGNDFKTADGTGVRDYIHIMDLAAGHSITLENILKKDWSGWNVYNFGAGTGYSVLDV